MSSSSRLSSVLKATATSAPLARMRASTSVRTSGTGVAAAAATPAARTPATHHLSCMKTILARCTNLWHGGFMRWLMRAFMMAAAVAAGGCFQSTTLITVNADGSGTIDEQVLFSGAALAQMRGLASLGGG